LPDSLTSVGDEMFYLCMAITSQTEFDNAYYLGNKRNPYVLLSIHKSRDVDSCVIHQRTKFIDRGAFAECRSLTKIEIPGSVLGIGCKAFYRCVSLESVTLGSGLAHIGDSAFYGCAFLRSVEYTSTREAWGRIAIGGNNEPLTKLVVRFRPTFSRPQ
ncbi:MAG: leucine-rich repeat domain-containing protein, partial [Clostridia bacterium]|nr:leucine-rich repeat domain-containing protein [Clostridia bacterium]